MDGFFQLSLLVPCGVYLLWLLHRNDAVPPQHIDQQLVMPRLRGSVQLFVTGRLQCKLGKLPLPINFILWGFWCTSADNDGDGDGTNGHQLLR